MLRGAAHQHAAPCQAVGVLSRSRTTAPHSSSRRAACPASVVTQTRPPRQGLRAGVRADGAARGGCPQPQPAGAARPVRHHQARRRPGPPVSRPRGPAAACPGLHSRMCSCEKRCVGWAAHVNVEIDALHLVAELVRNSRAQQRRCRRLDKCGGACSMPAGRFVVPARRRCPETRVAAQRAPHRPLH